MNLSTRILVSLLIGLLTFFVIIMALGVIFPYVAWMMLMLGVIVSPMFSYYDTPGPAGEFGSVFVGSIFLWTIIFSVPWFLYLTARNSARLAATPRAVSLSVAPNGKRILFVTSAHKLSLLDLVTKSTKVISDQANPYSAYYMRDSSGFVWQDLDNLVYIHDQEGALIDSFKHESVCKHVAYNKGDLYVSLDHNSILSIRKPGVEAILKAMGHPDVSGDNPYDIQLFGSSKTLLTSFFSPNSTTPKDSIGDDLRDTSPDLVGTRLWSLETGVPRAAFHGNTGRTVATMSPDEKWVLSGDEDGDVFLWPLFTQTKGKPTLTARLDLGLFTPASLTAGSTVDTWDRSKLIDVPLGLTNKVLALKFIHHSRYYLRFGYNSHYAALFEVDNPWPLKYFDLGTRPFPATDKYSRNLAIDTAPEAGILVMGQRDGSGILVYQFDPDELTLERVWVGR